jgi:NitT/TauT family transport system substrate-binding protein
MGIVTKILLRCMAAAGVAVAVTAYDGPAAAQQSPVPFKMGISSASVSILPVYFAEAGDFYAKNGLKVEIISAEGGTRGIQVLMSGEIQAMHVGLAPVVQANLQGADLRLIAASINTLPFSIYATKATTPPIPKGSTIGISTFGSETDIALSIALKQMGMSRDDVMISQIGGTSQRLAAMIAGRIDAAPLLEPAITTAKERGFHLVLDLAAARTPWIFDAVVVTNNELKAQPQRLEQFLRAYVEGAYKGLSDEKWAKSVIARRFRTNAPKVIDGTFDEYVRMMTRDATPSVKGAKNVLAQLKALNLPVGSENIDDYLAPALVQKLASDGFFADMRAKYGIK